MSRVVTPTDRRLKANRQQPNVRASLLMNQARQSQPTEVVSDYQDDDTKESGATATVTHSAYGRFPVYKLTPSGCVRIEVNAQSIADVLSQDHYSDVCFDCGRNDCLYATTIKGEIPTNWCAGKEPKKFRVCPEISCRKRIYDSQSTGMRLQDEFDHSARGDASDDPNVIQDDMYDSSTPEARTRAAMENHLIGFHPDTARQLGIGKTPELAKVTVI